MHTTMVPVSMLVQCTANNFASASLLVVYTPKEHKSVEHYQKLYPAFPFIETEEPLTLLKEEKASYLLGENLTLICYCPLSGVTTPYLTFHFHTLEDAYTYTRLYPNPAIDLPRLIEEDAKLLAEGKLVAFPTETVYGLGGDATNEEAVRGIFAAKERPFFDPLIVHIAELSQLDGLVAQVSDQAKALMEQFWPGPLTLVMKKHPQVADIVTAGSETVAVRMPANPLALALIKASGKPIAAPSANRFGYTSPTTAEHVREQLSGRIAAILDGGACTVGIESTVLALHTPIPTILRPGKIGIQELSPLLGEVAMAKQAGPTDTKMESPGLLESHYAPTTPLYLVDDVRQYQGCEDVGVLLSEDIGVSFKGPVAYISEDKDSEKAAMRLYWAIRKLDGMGLRCMVCSLLPEQGIGVAINNRLRKAATKKAQPSC
nr:L-threonylcarbamoyladenylate synthase [uncultured Sphaerochaeta sp.]